MLVLLETVSVVTNNTVGFCFFFDFQMESERFSHFVQEAWVNQKQWKEDERRRRIDEEKKAEAEAAAMQRKHEEEERKIEQERLKKQAEWKLQLESQVEEIK